MNVFAIIKEAPIAYDSAYLLGRVSSHSRRVHVTSGYDLSKIRSTAPPEFDVLLNRTIRHDIGFLKGLEELASDYGAVLINSPERTNAACDKRRYITEYSEYIPDTWVIQDENDLLLLLETVGCELVVKHPFGMGGNEIARISSAANIGDARRIFSASPGTSIVAQRFCNEFIAGDKRVILHRIEGNTYEIAAWYKRIPRPGGWISNLSFGGRVEKCDIDADEIDLCIKVAQIAGLDYVGLDIGKQEGKTYLIETNSYTGGHMDFDAIHQDKSSGEKFAELVDRLCQRKF
jgi:glutathione synthase/RimK-type ligase-like ATP-grasp enzyme